MLDTVLRPARSSKVLLVKNFQTHCSGHLFGDSWESTMPRAAANRMTRHQRPWPV